MTTRHLVFVSLLLLLVASAVQAETYGVVLTPSQETPPTASNGFGNATVTLDPSHTSINVKMTVAGLTSPVNNAHIHRGAFGVPGGVVINFQPATNLVNGRMDATLAIDKALGDEIAGNPGNFYVNVHTTQNSGGEIRGQLTPIGGVTSLFAELRGSNERPTPNSSTAVGSAFVTIDSNNVVTYEVNIGNLQSPTLSHIHIGDANTAGGIKVNLATNALAFSNGRTKGTIQIDQALAADIKTNPSGYYVNVHTTAFGGGEIRGQLAPANESDVPVAGNIASFVTDLRVFNPSYTSKLVALVELLPNLVSGNTNALASNTLEIAPRGEAVLDDVTNTGGLNSPGVLGALRITSQNELAATADIFSDQRATGKGTFGQFVPALLRSTADRRGVLPHLSNRTPSSPATGFRTNIGFFNPTQQAVDVRLELRDGSGAVLGQTNISLPAVSQQQASITNYFSSLDLSNAPTLTLSYDASAPIFAYAAVNDNASTDSFVVIAQHDPGVSASQQ